MLPKRIYKPLLAAVLLSSVSGIASAELVVIVHPSNAATIDSTQVQRIFLGKEKKFADGNEATPINTVASNASREQFDTKILERSSSQVAAYWSKLVFTGKGIPPKELENDAAVIATVAADASAIGYVDSAAVTGAVKVITLN
ncbi:MAG: phosphate ABC transporter substrate-binding protein [Paraglaciecola sp.]|nr:phosphate ABC transporter substrate-binding protein [Paraglaciecola sp.]NCT48424.1 phosphate ABC transporter substrate-binding protein [Paraglaciecola sp.]